MESGLQTSSSALEWKPEITDPPLLRNNSELKSYQTQHFTYGNIRVFYRRHPKFDELPAHPAPLPLLVLIHGLGGSVAQFHPLLTSLSNNASCLAIDLPGCGRSEFHPRSWEAYHPDALIELLEIIIDEYREKRRDQGVVLIGHSMGSALAARLANPHAAHVTDLPLHVMGVIGICPLSGPPPQRQVSLFRHLLHVPTWLFDLWRKWDQWGGSESASVKRFVGPEADLVARQLQNRYNKQSRTDVFRRVAWGFLPEYVDGKPKGGLFGQPVWEGLGVPVFLVGGASDAVTSPKEIDKVASILDQDISKFIPNENRDRSYRVKAFSTEAPVVEIPRANGHLPRSIDAINDTHFVARNRLINVEESFEDPTTPQSPRETALSIPPQPLHPGKIIKTRILPAPATHALLFLPSTTRTLSGLVCDFLSDHITGRFDLGWQLQHLSKEGKWDVKNLEKWKSVQPVSAPILGIFRAMKTLREVDEEHSPKAFAAKWGHTIKDVVDISHDTPVYDSRRLERDNIKYNKLATVSKVPPTDAEVEIFINLVDRVREEQKIRAESECWPEEYFIGVHCHYGFNRTGYFVVCYLVERCDLGVGAAIDLFAKARPNGIRHSHFLDRLHLRYSGLQ